MSGHRESVVLATKYSGAAATTDPNASGNHRKSMVQALEASLRRLKTDYIDLYWLHMWDQLTRVEEVMRALDDLVRQGKVLYAGISDAPAWWIAEGNTLASLRGWSPFVSLQIEYSLLERTVERELIPMAKAFGLGVTAWSPLAGGVLSGKYASGQGSDARYSSDMMKSRLPDRERTDRLVGALDQVSKQLGRSKAQVALAWLRHRDVPVIPIIGARKIGQLQDNLASLTITLDRDQLTILDDASKIELGFPHELYQVDLIRTLVYGGLRDRIVT
jgi:aryl-alcohol dehydrogenase-like predicted oxidoreductase